MAKVRGLDNFKSFFSSFENDFVIIGGTAASILMEDADLTFRATKDIDLVILSHQSKAIATKIVEYVKLAGYEIRQASDGKPKYYRFSKPMSAEYPHMLEIFASNSGELELQIDQNIIPVPVDDENKLSAILLDDVYFNLVKDNSITSDDGYRIINNFGNICMKAKAFREMTERKAKGEAVDTRDIEKHRNDVLKLSLTLRDADKMPLDGLPSADLSFAIAEIRKLTTEQVKGILKEYGNQNLATILGRITTVFGL